VLPRFGVPAVVALSCAPMRSCPARRHASSPLLLTARGSPAVSCWPLPAFRQQRGATERRRRNVVVCPRRKSANAHR